jgi:glycosyltransferase involved in cell wall biosynthesis
MAEAMATGTPVIASHNGSTPEVVRDGVTGFVCETIKEMIEAVPKVASLDRAACRAHVERYFSPAAMADGYERVYARVLGEPGSAAAAPLEDVTVAVAMAQEEGHPPTTAGA